MNDNTLRQLQIIETDILKAVADVCDKNDITYYLSSGTLLGAVRHNGFIPWDDDIDVTMPYRDYCKFLEVAQDELGDKFFLQTGDTDKNWYKVYARIRLNNTTMLLPEYRSMNLNHGIWLDVFPIIETGSGVKKKITWIKMKLATYTVMDELVNNHKTYSLKHKTRCRLLKIVYLIPKSFRKALHDKLIQNLGTQKGSYYTWLWNTTGNTIPKEYVDGKPSTVCFEGHDFTTYPRYSDCLKLHYGNYMELPPVDQRVGHGEDMIIDFENSYSMYLEL